MVLERGEVLPRWSRCYCSRARPRAPPAEPPPACAGAGARSVRPEAPQERQGRHGARLRRAVGRASAHGTWVRGACWSTLAPPAGARVPPALASAPRASAMPTPRARNRWSMLARGALSTAFTVSVGVRGRLQAALATENTALAHCCAVALKLQQLVAAHKHKARYEHSSTYSGHGAETRWVQELGGRCSNFASTRFGTAPGLCVALRCNALH